MFTKMGNKKKEMKSHQNNTFNSNDFTFFLFLFRLMFIELKCNLKVKNIAKKSFDHEESSSLIEAIVNRHAYSNSERERESERKKVFTLEVLLL